MFKAKRLKNTEKHNDITKSSKNGEASCSASVFLKYAFIVK